MKIAFNPLLDWHPVDVTVTPRGIKVATPFAEYTYGLRGVKRITVTDPENMARICRRTMKPYGIVHSRNGAVYECMSYPFPENGGCFVMARYPNNSQTLTRMDVTLLREVPLGIRKTGIPANDPIQVQA